MLAGHTYTVQAGDYLSAIAPRYGESWQKLYADNRDVVGGDPNLIYPGTVLRVRAGGKTWHVRAAAKPGAALSTTARSAAPTTRAASESTPTTSAASAGIGGSIRSLIGRTFGSQAACAANIVKRESGFSVTATNPTDGAYGLPQAYPAWKMASAGADWRTNPLTQLRWMRAYVDSVYGGACNAWAHWQRYSSY